MPRAVRAADQSGSDGWGRRMRISETQEWQALTEHHGQVGGRHLRDLFAEDPTRGEALTAGPVTCTWTTPRTG